MKEFALFQCGHGALAVDTRINGITAHLRAQFQCGHGALAVDTTSLILT